MAAVVAEAAAIGATEETGAREAVVEAEAAEEAVGAEGTTMVVAVAAAEAVATEAVTETDHPHRTIVVDGGMNALTPGRTLHVDIKGPGAASNFKSGTPVQLLSNFQFKC